MFDDPVDLKAVLTIFSLPPAERTHGSSKTSLIGYLEKLSVKRARE